MINKVILVGRLGADPEVRYTPDGLMITNLRLATDEVRKDRNGERLQKTEWHRVVTFGKLAEICGKYLSKGRLIYVEGKIRTQQWQDKDGNKRYTTDIIASNMQMLESKGGARPDDATSAYDAMPPFPDSDSMIEEDVPF